MIKSLEGLRGIAALVVALYHLKIGSDYFSFIRNGYLFVDLFFVLSGFVICAAYANRLQTSEDLKPFILRRFGRLFPLLVFSTFVFVLASNAIVFAKTMVIASGHGGFLNNPGSLEYLVPRVSEILATLTFTHSLGIFDDLILNTPTWSISTEFYTYFLFAALCLMLHGRNRVIAFTLLSIMGLIASVWASVNIHDCLAKKGCLSLTYDFGFIRCVYSFFLGTLVYYTSRWLHINHGALQVTGIFGLFLLFSVVDDVPVAAFVFPVGFAVIVLSLCADNGSLSDVLKFKPFQLLGERSYSIYLLHMPLLLIFENLTKRSNGFLSSTLILTVYVTTLVIISGWSYRFIESPMRDMFNRLATPATVPGTGTAH
jgi:peptidoglycan/LPS O-acetylase OafA/YrhL